MVSSRLSCVHRLVGVVQFPKGLHLGSTALHEAPIPVVRAKNNRRRLSGCLCLGMYVTVLIEFGLCLRLVTDEHTSSTRAYAEPTKPFPFALLPSLHRRSISCSHFNSNYCSHVLCHTYLDINSFLLVVQKANPQSNE